MWEVRTVEQLDYGIRAQRRSSVDAQLYVTVLASGLYHSGPKRTHGAGCGRVILSAE